MEARFKVVVREATGKKKVLFDNPCLDYNQSAMYGFIKGLLLAYHGISGRNVECSIYAGDELIRYGKTMARGGKYSDVIFPLEKRIANN